MGSFLHSPRGNQYLFVVTDHFTKWVELFPLRKLDSQKIWDSLLQTFARFGFPTSLISDNASYFTSKVFVHSCAVLGIEHKRTSPYHPQGTITERVNRNLKMMLVAHTNRHKDWDAKLQEMAFATHTTANRSTGLSPAQLKFGKELAFPISNALRSTVPTPQCRSYSKLAYDLRKRFSDNLREARESLDVARLQQSEQYNQGSRNLMFEVGDLVLRRNHPLSDATRGFTASLATRWEGPFRVSKKLSPLTYTLIRCSSGQSTGPIHVTDLNLFHSQEEFSQDLTDGGSSRVPDTI